jgi:hypothetical protein
MLGLVKYETGCKTKQQYIDDGFQVFENSDGTVSIFDQNQGPITAHESKSCCEVLGYEFDIETQKCRWGTDDRELFKIILNPQGNTSVLFNVEENETCCIDISFDYLFKFECDTLHSLIKPEPCVGPGCGGPPGGTSPDIPTLESLEEDLLTQQEICERWQYELEIATDIPYVIECTDGGKISLSDGKLSKSSPTVYYTKGTDLPPSAYGEYDPNIITYCLTDEGLAAWEIIINNNAKLGSTPPYNIWLASEGTDTSTYGCDDVQIFVETEPSPGLWYTETCDYSIYDKSRSKETIANIENELELCQDQIAIIEAQIAALPPEEVERCSTYASIFETFDVCFTLEKLNETTGLLETVYEETLLNIGEGNLYEYINASSGNTGIMISGSTGLMPTIEEEAFSTRPSESNDCNIVRQELVQEIYDQYLIDNEVPSTQSQRDELASELTNWYQSCWLQYESKICDPDIISLIENENINLSISVKDCCTDFSILLDRVKMYKNCEKIDNVETFIDEAPKFNLRKVADNKKSWIANKNPDERDFELKYRGTEYNTNHHRLVINTKEVDLNLSPARAVEQDVWCYINDNNCILEGCLGDGSFSAFTCPSGYTMTSDGNVCQDLTITASTSAVTQYNVGTGNVVRTSETFNLSRGTIFVENVDGKDLPIYWTGTPNESWVGPYYNSDYLVDSSGQFLTHTGFGEKYNSDGSLKWSSPEAFCGIYSQFGQNNNTFVGVDLNPNLLWGGTNAGNSGRLRQTAVWTDPSTLAEQEWIGFASCFELEETKIYRIGFAADNTVRLKLNGEYIFNNDITPDFDELTNGQWNPSYSREIQAWVVIGITLPSGKNVIEMEGWNTVSTSAVGFGVEIYDATEEQLRNMRTESELASVTVFSTNDEVGNTFQLGENSGYSCPTGYVLDTCITAPYQCVKIEKIRRDEIQDNCCCEGFPIQAISYDNATVELPLTYSTGSTLDCNDIQTLINGFSATTTLESISTRKCGTVYALGTGTTTTFDGFWFVEENDGTIGVYEVDYVSGSTETYENVSDQVTSECCTIINDGFQTYSDMFEQGVNTYVNVSYDPNKERCVYRKCGDDGCINVDTMLTTELSTIDTVTEFETVLSSELIDVKNRQTVSSYPTLRMLYDRYNNHALEYCDVDSSRFDYFDMDKFGQTVGNYWVDLIEQVIPATTIWGSTYTYKNTIFDTQKYNYKRNNLFTCDNPSDSFPWSAISTDMNVDVILQTLDNPEGEDIISATTTTDPNGDLIIGEKQLRKKPPTLLPEDLSGNRNCSGVWNMQHTCGSEFIGTVTIIETNALTGDTSGVFGPGQGPPPGGP